MRVVPYQGKFVKARVDTDKLSLVGSKVKKTLVLICCFFDSLSYECWCQVPPIIEDLDRRINEDGSSIPTSTETSSVHSGISWFGSSVYCGTSRCSSGNRVPNVD
eukprot:gb/GECG01010320.1/.p1 GENE.gb/GECG01010320.1/~~gb/GECG01010320.1/.p1  ORF type:complete len:105 (+),score=10.94 gb/GECG01010320.1/:1-315(+)